MIIQFNMYSKKRFYLIKSLSISTVDFEHVILRWISGIISTRWNFVVWWILWCVSELILTLFTPYTFYFLHFLCSISIPSENVFRGCRNVILAWKGLTYSGQSSLSISSKPEGFCSQWVLTWNDTELYNL